MHLIPGCCLLHIPAMSCLLNVAFPMDPYPKNPAFPVLGPLGPFCGLSHILPLPP